MLTCAIVAVTIATATETTIYYAIVDTSVIEHRDFREETSKLSFAPREEIRMIRDLPGLSPRVRRHCRDAYENLYASLTGGVL